MKKSVKIQSIIYVIVIMIYISAQAAMRSIAEHKSKELTIEKQFICAAQRGDTDELRKVYFQDVHGYLLNYQDDPNKWSALHYATHAQQKSSVELLLTLRANVCIKTSYENTPLHIAVGDADTEIIKLLLEKCAPINSTNKDGNTPLHLAAELGKKEIMELLLSQGACSSIQNKYGKTADEIITDKKEAARMVPSLLSRISTALQSSLGDMSPLGSVDLDTSTLTIGKTVFGSPKKKRSKPCLSKKMTSPKKKTRDISSSEELQIGFSMIDLTKLSTTTALSSLKVGGTANVEFIDMLSSSSADKGIQGQDKDESILQIAPQNGTQTMATTLVRATLLQSVIKRFMYAAQGGNTEELTKLYAQHTRLLNYQDGLNAWSALHYAVCTGQKKSVVLLLDLKANVYTKTSKGDEPLHIAAQIGNKEIVRLLLEKRAPINSTNKDGNTPLHLAAEVGEKGITSLLLSQGARFDLHNKYGKTANRIMIDKGGVAVIIPFLLSPTSLMKRLSLSSAHTLDKENLGTSIPCVSNKRAPLKEKIRDRSNSKIVQEEIPIIDLTQEQPAISSSSPKVKCITNNRELLVKPSYHREIIETLLKAGIDKDAVDRNGRTFLHRAVFHNYENVVAVLLKVGAKMEIVDKHGFTALHIAALKGHGMVTMMLLTAGAKIEARDKYGFTALHWAALDGHKCVVEALLEAGANPNTIDKNGVTPLSLAVLSGYKTIIELLLRAGADKDVVDIHGNTLLHLAVRNNHNVIVELLLWAGCNQNIINKQGFKAIHWALSKGYKSIVELFLKDKDERITLSTSKKDKI